MNLIASHAVFGKNLTPIHGTGSEIETYFQKIGEKYVFLKHPLYYGNKTRVEIFDGSKVEIKQMGFSNIPFFLARLQDQIITFFYLFKLFPRLKIFIGIDPFNGFTGIIAKRLGLVKNCVFYTADYAIKRFENPFMNYIYHWFDRFCIKNADYIWNVSIKIQKLRGGQGVPATKNIFLPNTPEFEKVKRFPLSKIEKSDIVIVTNLISSLDYILIFKTIKKLSVKHKKIRLFIIGEGKDEEKIRRYLKKIRIYKLVKFFGKKSHNQVLNILTKCGIGLALYTKTNPWTEFGDSMKVREYLACGLPVVMNDVVSTSEDVKKANAGIVVKNSNEEGLYLSIDKLLSDDILYKKIRENAINLAKKYDFSVLFKDALERIR